MDDEIVCLAVCRCVGARALIIRVHSSADIRNFGVKISGESTAPSASSSSSGLGVVSIYVDGRGPIIGSRRKGDGPIWLQGLRCSTDAD